MTPDILPKALYELGRLASGQSPLEALPDIRGLAWLLDQEFVERRERDFVMTADGSLLLSALVDKIISINSAKEVIDQTKVRPG